MRGTEREGGKVSLYSNRTRQGTTVQGGLAGFGGWKGYRSSRMADRDRIVMILARYSWYPYGGVAGKVEGGGQWVLIDLCSQSGLKSSTSHGVHGQAVGVGRSVRSSQTARSPWPSPPGM